MMGSFLTCFDVHFVRYILVSLSASGFALLVFAAVASLASHLGRGTPKEA